MLYAVQVIWGFGGILSDKIFTVRCQDTVDVIIDKIKV